MSVLLTNNSLAVFLIIINIQTEPVALWNERQAREKQQRCPKTSESGLMACWNVLVSGEIRKCGGGGGGGGADIIIQRGPGRGPPLKPSQLLWPAFW